MLYLSRLKNWFQNLAKPIKRSVCIGALSYNSYFYSGGTKLKPILRSFLKTITGKLRSYFYFSFKRT